MTTRTPGTQEKPYTILSFIDDYKQERWQEASKGTLQFKAMSRGRAALTLLLNPLLGRSDAVIFRYLNDSRGKVSILRRLIIELLVCLAARLRNAEIIWFAHNVDRESTVKHPVLNTLRRKIIGHFCARVLVTDESLIEEARARLPCMDQKPIQACTFGRVEVRHATPRDKRQPPADLSAVPRGQAFYIASINNWVAKKRQELDLLLSIAKSASTASRRDLVFILAGPQTTQIRQQAPQLYAELQSMPNLYIIEGNIEFKQLVDAGICDAIVKTYSDLSLSLSLFQACSLGLAIIAEQESYMGAFVLENKVGISVEKSSIQIQEIMDRISQIRSSEEIYTEFFRKYSWENGARTLASPAKQQG